MWGVRGNFVCQIILAHVGVLAARGGCPNIRTANICFVHWVALKRLPRDRSLLPALCQYSMNEHSYEQ